MEEKTLTIEKRIKFKKSASKRSRREGKIPAVIYGHTEPVPILVDEREFHKKFNTVSENTLINLKTKKESYEVLVKDYQDNIITGKITHIDFFEVEKGKLLKTHVPIHIKGVAVGVKEGGLVEQLLHEIEVECLPKNIPADLVVDITDLELGKSIHVEELEVPNGVKYFNAPEQVVVHITHKKAEEVEVAAEGVEEAEEAAEAGETKTQED